MIARKGGALCGLFIVAAVCVSWDRVVSGQNRDGGRRPQAVVRGTVTAADSGLPLRLAEVQISGGSLKSPLVVLTDSSGGYELRDLPAGQYSLTAWKLGYVKTGYKGGRSGEGKLLVVDGQSAEATTIDFSLPRAGVIVASVTDEYGEPVAGARVSVLRAEGSAPQRKLVDASGNGFIATTDDRGEVRLFNLAPGTYYAAARKSALSRVGSRRQATAQVFYPGTLSQADAQPITLAAGVEVRVPIPLIDGRLARVSGVVLSSGGEPDPASTVQLTNVGAAISTGQPVTRSPDGQFLATGVPPGTYVLQVRPTQASSRLEYANYEFQVTGDDIEGLTVITTPAARIVGRITFEGAPTAPGVSPSAFTLTTQSDAAMRVAPGRVSISKDWMFEIRDILGTGFLVLDDRTQTWLIDSISEGDRDITDQRMDFKALDGKVLELRLTRQRTVVLGSAAASNGPAIKDFVAVMFSEDPSRWYRHSRYLKTATPDQFGHFRIAGLPPGSYLLVAVTGMEKGDEYNAEYLERLRPTAVRLTLAKGESKQVAVTVSPMPK